MSSMGYITNLDDIGIKVSKDSGVAIPKDHEYDIVIIGGGEHSHLVR